MDRCFYTPFPEVSAVTFSFSCNSNESLAVISITWACYSLSRCVQLPGTGERVLLWQVQVSCDEFSLGIKCTHRAAPYRCWRLCLPHFISKYKYKFFCAALLHLKYFQESSLIHLKQSKIELYPQGNGFVAFSRPGNTCT